MGEKTNAVRCLGIDPGLANTGGELGYDEWITTQVMKTKKSAINPITVIVK